MEPGRIPPIQKSNASSVAKAIEDPKGFIIEKATDRLTSGVTQYLVNRDNKNRYQKALKRAQQSEQVPDKPEYRINYLGSGGIIIALAIVVDLIGILGTFLIELLGIPEIIVEIVDMLYGVILLAFMVFKKFDFASHYQRYLSVISAFFLEEIPLLNAAPFWTLDAWYVVHSTRAEDRETHRQLLETVEAEKQEEERRIFMENFALAQAEAAEGNRDEG